MARCIQRGGCPGVRVEALDGTKLVVGVRALPHRRAFDISATAVVAQIERAVRTDSKAVGSTTRVREHAGGTIWGHPRAATMADFGQHHGAVCTDHGAFREAESSGNNGDIAHDVLLPMVVLQKTPVL